MGLLDVFTYPEVGFHFSVFFELFPQLPNDLRFREVSGLTVDFNTEEVKEGGENRFTHKLPVRSQYGEITLKRGMFLGSGIVAWCQNAIENFEFEPTNVLISLLNDKHIPVQNWYVIGAIPKKLDISAFNAERSEVVVETLVLSYQYFKTYNLSSLIGEVSVSFSISGGVSI